MNRCSWAGKDSNMQHYHDKEWGVPEFDDRVLFEHLILDIFQAGLSWAVVLNKRENFRKSFDNFNPEKVAIFDREKIHELMFNSGIIRNQKKITASILNARALINIQEQYGSFAGYLWEFTGGKPIVNHYNTWEEIPSNSPTSIKLSKELKKQGFQFTGPTVIYAFMQAVGMVNDHVVTCFRHKEIEELSKKLSYPKGNIEL